MRTWQKMGLEYFVYSDETLRVLAFIVKENEVFQASGPLMSVTHWLTSEAAKAHVENVFYLQDQYEAALNV